MGLLLSLFDEVDGSWEGVGPGPGGGGVRLGWAEDEDEDEREDEDGNEPAPDSGSSSTGPLPGVLPGGGRVVDGELIGSDMEGSI